MDKKNKIGILTFHGVNNYGAVLQAFALQHYLFSINVNNEIINYDLATTKNLNCFQFFIYSVKTFIKCLLNKDILIKSMRFSNFRKKNLLMTHRKIHSDKRLAIIEEKYDSIIVGSDQVWNSQLTNNSNTFYLPFYKNNKVSYAASYGRGFLLDIEKDNAKIYLKNFSHISVREKEVIAQLNELTNKEICHVIDPVFLLNRDNWNSLLDLSRFAKDKYILVYSMEYSDLMIKTLEYIRNISNIKIIILNGGGNHSYKIFGKEIKNCGPKEFLSFIKNAEYVVTNSFHGLAFSLILEKKLICVSHSTRNERLSGLLSLIGYKENQVAQLNQINGCEKRMIDGTGKYEELKNIIEKSKDFLQNAIT